MILSGFEQLYRAFGTIDRPSLDHCSMGGVGMQSVNMSYRPGGSSARFAKPLDERNPSKKYRKLKYFAFNCTECRMISGWVIMKNSTLFCDW